VVGKCTGYQVVLADLLIALLLHCARHLVLTRSHRLVSVALEDRGQPASLLHFLVAEAGKGPIDEG
jgi:hypothetical protein